MLTETMETSRHVDYQIGSRLLLWGAYKQILRQTTFMALQKICLIISVHLHTNTDILLLRFRI